MSSLARIAASRANGRLSRGPKTAAGKARSSRNNTRHGLLSSEGPTPDPSDPAYQALLASYRRRFPTADPVIPYSLALCQWRLRYSWTMEKQWLDELIAIDPNSNPNAQIAHAFAALAGTNKYRLLMRFEGRQHRWYSLLLKSLLCPHASKNDGSNLAESSPAVPPAATLIKNDGSNLESPALPPASCTMKVSP